MNLDNVVYELSAKGEKELTTGRTTLPPLELELLVRINGVQTLAKIREGMPTWATEELARAFRHLLELKLLNIVAEDPFASRFLIELDEMALALAAPEADSGTASLRKAG